MLMHLNTKRNLYARLRTTIEYGIQPLDYFCKRLSSTNINKNPATNPKNADDLKLSNVLILNKTTR